MDTIFKMQCLLIYVVLFTISTCSGTNEPASPSITVKEDFNSPAIITPISGYGPPPMVSNFVHQGTNFFFNPQFLLGNNVPPPLGAVVAAIPNPPNGEVILNQTVITPELPIVTPVEVIVEEPIEVIAPPPPPPSLIPVIPEMPEVPVLIRTIPPAPVLPPLVLPKIPVWVEESIEVVPPCEEKQIVITEIKPLPPVVIPQPPSLPLLVLPPKISMTEIEIKSQQPVDAATAVPIVPNKDVSMEFSKLKLTNEESLQVISATPVEEIDFKINEIPSSIEFPDFDKLLSVGEDKRVIMIPSPELPVIEIPKPISEVLLIEKDKKLVLPTQLPTDCARDIVLERVLPNMISKKTVTKSLEIISFPAAKYPVIAPLYPTL